METLTAADVSAGLPAAAAASALLGKSGAAALLVLLFLAVTSAASAELIAVSSILTYDVYKVSRSGRFRVVTNWMGFSKEVLQPACDGGAGFEGVSRDGKSLRVYLFNI